MKKKVFGRQFKRDANERKALFKGLMSDLVMKESIRTTLPKAKSIKGQVEKLVTKAKVRGAESRAFIQPYVSSPAVDKIISDLAVRFADRPGGYTRIVKLGSRFSDNADMAMIEWVVEESGIMINQEVSKDVKTVETSEKVQSTVSAAAKKEKTTKKVLKSEKKETKKKGAK